MELIDCGITGRPNPSNGLTWEDLNLSAPWVDVARLVSGNSEPRPIQVKAFQGTRILESRRNLIVAAPTNAGKSLVGIVTLLDTIRTGGRAVLLEPLRALAREKAEELQSVQSALGRVMGLELRISLTTGDYRLADEQFTDPPPGSGHVVIATPERFDAILRIPEYQDWVASVTAVCVDEAHLISNPRRGPVLEYLITHLLCLPQPPRLILLSASMGQTSRAQNWLDPCDLIDIQQRVPPLQKYVGVLSPSDDMETEIGKLVENYLSEPSAAVLVFVYQTASTETLAKLLCTRLNGKAGSAGTLAYHAQMNAAQRESVRNSFANGESRCVVTTTALGLGVNLPATHVIVRDVTFPGEGPQSISDILQMMGRAGRGQRSGTAIVLVRPNDRWSSSDLVAQVKEEPLPELQSSFDVSVQRKSRFQASELATSVVPLVASQLARHPETGISVEDLRLFFARSLGGNHLACRVQESLAWLSDLSRILAFRNKEGRYQLTTLGLLTNRSTLPVEIASASGQLIRDLLQLDNQDSYLSQWKPLDHLVLIECLSERSPSIRRFSKDLTGQVDAWMEENPSEVPTLYRDWIRGENGTSKAEQLLGSLGMNKTPEASRQHAYLAVLRAIVLYERGMGTAATNLERRWFISNLAGVEEPWRDTMLWMTAAFGKILETRCFFYCLKEQCQADFNRIRRVTRIFRMMRQQLFGIQEHLKYCSPLGGVLKSMRRTQETRIGTATIRKLEMTGVTSFATLSVMTVDQMVKLGIRRNTARAIWSYTRRRLQ